MPKVTSFLEFKKKYELIYLEVKDKFKENNLSLKDYDLDYFDYDKNNHTFYVSFSSKNVEKLLNVDIKGEFLDDEVLITNFTDSSSNSDSDFYDLEDPHMDYVDDEHDNEY